MQPQFGELRQTLRGKVLHKPREVASRHRGDQARRCHVAHEPQRFPRRAEADFHFRADGDPSEIPPQRVDDERVGLVPAVVAHPLPQQAGGNADANGRNGGLSGWSIHGCLSSAPGKRPIRLARWKAG